MLPCPPLFRPGVLLLNLMLMLVLGAPCLALAEGSVTSRPTEGQKRLAVAPPSTALRPTAELVRLVRQDCGSCHGLRLTGGLGSPLTASALAARALPPEAIEATILHGRPGTAMPAWKSLLSEAEARWITEQLLHGFPEEP
jgi:cytochrome c55X